MKDPPAFPVNELHPDSGRIVANYAGMTLKDYFAAKAMQAHWSDTDSSDVKAVVKASYELADAMLKERRLWGS